jgi:AcrR family transcriptional regulator
VLLTGLSIAVGALFLEDPGMAAKKAPRRRRTAEEAREEILDAAERAMRDGGADAIRLQDIAAHVGISHPAVLHHFGSREGLVEAVIDRTMTKLESELLSVFMRGIEGGKVPDAVDVTERVADALGARGQARLIAWLALSGHQIGHSKQAREGWKAIIDATHAIRLTRLKKKEKKPSLEDTTFTVALSSITLFGEAIIGAGTLEAAGLPSDERTRRRFRAWFAKLLERHLEDP